MKCSTIQCENVNRGHAAAIIATNVQNSMPFHGHKPRDVISICHLTHRQLSAVRQTRLLSDAAAIDLSKFKIHLRWSLSIFMLQILSRIC